PRPRTQRTARKGALGHDWRFGLEGGYHNARGPMTQDTRKDPRAKIVSLNVRYKSAAGDGFIENPAHHASKGGGVLQTANPCRPGTLLKFEIRLASDQSVIAGVGRVVWKRDGASSGPERPSGMGVKFIKIDDASRSVIDRLTSAKDDAGSAFLTGAAEAGVTV